MHGLRGMIGQTVHRLALVGSSREHVVFAVTPLMQRNAWRRVAETEVVPRRPDLATPSATMEERTKRYLIIVAARMPSMEAAVNQVSTYPRRGGGDIGSSSQMNLATTLSCGCQSL